MSAGARLRERLQRKKFVVGPGIVTALQAMLMDRAGFDFVYVGRYDVALTLLGVPDARLMTSSEMLANARNIAQSVSLPVLADIGTGYGNAVNTVRTVRDCETAGLAGVRIDDHVLAGPGAAPQPASIDEVSGKLRAALDARRDSSFMVIARTHVRGAAGTSVEEAARRARTFAGLGCDAVCADLRSVDTAHARSFAEDVRKEFPDVLLYMDYVDGCTAPFDAFAEMGYCMMHVPELGLRATLRATWDYATALKSQGARAEVEFQKRLLSHPMGAFHREGFKEIKALEAKYLPADEVRIKYDAAVGH